MDLVALGLAVWARVLSRRDGAPKWLVFFPWVILLCFVVSFSATLLGLREAFVSIEYSPPDQKAQLLSEGIARAMSYTAFGLVLDAVFLVVLIAMSVRLKKPSAQHRSQ